MSLDAITDKVLPDESDPLSMRRWRLRIAAVACSNWLFTFVILVPVLVAVLFTGNAITGRVAYADDQNAKVAKVEAKVDTILKLSLEQRMREINDEICLAQPGRTKDILENSLSEMQNDYKQLTGENYRLAWRCRAGNG